MYDAGHNYFMLSMLNMLYVYTSTLFIIQHTRTCTTHTCAELMFVITPLYTNYHITHTHTHTHTHMHMHTTHVHMHTHMHMHTLTRTHSHSLTQLLLLLKQPFLKFLILSCSTTALSCKLKPHPQSRESTYQSACLHETLKIIHVCL